MPLGDLFDQREGVEAVTVSDYSLAHPPSNCLDGTSTCTAGTNATNPWLQLNLRAQVELRAGSRPPTRATAETQPSPSAF